MPLNDVLRPSAALILHHARSRAELLAVLASRGAELVDGHGAEDLLARLEAREQRYPTSTPEGVAFPHAMLPGMGVPVLLPAIARPPVPFGSADDQPPSDVIFAIFGDESRPFQHVQLLSRLSRIARVDGALDRLRAVGHEREIVELLVEIDAGLS